MSSHGQRIAPGRVVHFVMGDGQIRPAQITRLWGPDPTGEEIRYPDGYPAGMYSAVQLLITLDGENDASSNLEGEITRQHTFITHQLESLTHTGLSKREAIHQLFPQLAPSVLLYYSHYQDERDPQNDQLAIHTVCTVKGWHGWATSVSYDPYDWQPRTWHWPQDARLVKPTYLEPAASC